MADLGTPMSPALEGKENDVLPSKVRGCSSVHLSFGVFIAISV